MGNKFVILVVVMVGVAVALMVQASQAGTSHVYSPSELAAQVPGVSIPRLRVVGRVSAGTEIKYQTEPRAELRFSIIDPPPKIPARGVVPGDSSTPDAPTLGAPTPGGGAASAGSKAEGARDSPSGTTLDGTTLDGGTLEGGLSMVAVVYRGLRPDMFSAGRDVIIDGSFEGGSVVANTLLTQCPSKYEAPSPEKKYGVNNQQVYAPASSGAQSGSQVPGY